jgi:hypothetical protein
MAVRVTATEVKEIMDNCTVTDPKVDAFILAANDLINRVFSGVTSLSATSLKEIERWLTAHLIASTVFRQTSDEKLGEAAVKYTGKWGENLASTSYGQMVLMLDTTGKLASVGKQEAFMRAVKSFE